MYCNVTTLHKIIFRDTSSERGTFSTSASLTGRDDLYDFLYSYLQSTASEGQTRRGKLFQGKSNANTFQ